MIDILKDNPTKPKRSSKLSTGHPVEIHSHGNSTNKQAKQLVVAQRRMCKRVKKVGVKTNKGGAAAKYEKVGSKDFRCSVCKRVKPLSKRSGRKCHKCVNELAVSTAEGALRFRFTMKKSVARRKGIEFNLTFEYFKRLFEQQDGEDGYTGKQMSFSFGHGRSRATGSLDRIDNEEGYVPGNVVLCRLDTNSMKGAKPIGEFRMQMELDFTSGVTEVSQPRSEEVANLEKTI
jgi:hypothetical protein